MNVGEKIRNLRLEKLMTQADLAGDQITRNMLCTIERGAALPSLPTACYIAGRLSVPVGYLLAEVPGEGSANMFDLLLLTSQQNHMHFVKNSQFHNLTEGWILIKGFLLLYSYVCTPLLNADSSISIITP